MPTTPILESTFETASSPFELPSPSKEALSLPEPEYNWHEKDLSKTSGFEFSHAYNQITMPLPAYSAYTPTRPALKRRDTPRPRAQLFAPITAVREKKLTSVIDGRAWVVVGN
jgi:hypothetical protein